MNRKCTTIIKYGFTFILASLTFMGCGRDAVRQTTGFTNNLPFQVRDSEPQYLATGVPLTTSEIVVYFTEPVDLSTVSTSYKLIETNGASTVDITSRITGVSPLQGGLGLLFQISGNLVYNRGYTLTLYPGIVSSIGNYLSYLTRVSFTTGPTDSFGYGEIILPGNPEIDGDLQQTLNCGCLTIFARFKESLARSPVFRYEIQNAFGLLGNLASGGTGEFSAYPIYTNDNTTWGVFLGCTQQNQAADRVLKIKVIGSTVYDLEGQQMIGDKEKRFTNPWFYSCP